MSRENDYKALAELKAKLEAYDCAHAAVSLAKDNLNNLINESETVSLVPPVRPEKNDHESVNFYLEHSDSMAKRYSVFVWFVFVLISLLILAGGYLLFEFAQMNITTMHTAFGKWLMESFGAFELSDRIIMYAATVALAVLNLYVCRKLISKR